MPFDSGSCGGSCTTFVARAPVNATTAATNRPRRPTPVSLSHNNRRGTALSCPAKKRRHPSHDIRGLARRTHRRGDEPGERRHHHQHRWYLAATQRDPRRREPQVALRLIPRPIRQPVRRVLRRVLRTQQRDLLTKPRPRPRPTHPLSDHRGRHRRELGQQLTHPRLERIKCRRPAHPHILRWRSRHDCPGHGVTRDPQPPGDRPLRQPLAPVQIPDLCPGLQADHLPNRDWVADLQRAPVAWFSRSADTGFGVAVDGLSRRPGRGRGRGLCGCCSARARVSSAARPCCGPCRRPPSYGPRRWPEAVFLGLLGGTWPFRWPRRQWGRCLARVVQRSRARLA